MISGGMRNGFLGGLIAVQSSQRCPEKTTEFSGDGDDDLVAMESTRRQASEAQMEAVLSLPADCHDIAREALLPARKFLADFGGDGIVLDAFDQHPAQMSIAGLGDGALLAVRPARMLATDQTEIGHEGTGMSKPIDIAEFTDHGYGGNELEALEGHECLHSGLQSPVG